LAVVKFKTNDKILKRYKECSIKIVIEQSGLEWKNSDWAILAASVIPRVY